MKSITRKTKTIKRSLRPWWNETFEIEVEHYDKLILDVYDENRMTRDDFLGRAIIVTSFATRSKQCLGLGDCNEGTSSQYTSYMC